jgi:hypothetical protein
MAGGCARGRQVMNMARLYLGYTPTSQPGANTEPNQLRAESGSAEPLFRC